MNNSLQLSQLQTEAPETLWVHMDTTTVSIDKTSEQIVKQLLGE